MALKKPQVAPKRKKLETYASYIRKVWKARGFSGKISGKAMHVLNAFMADTFQRIARQSSDVFASTPCKTLLEQTIMTSLRLLLPRDLELHARPYIGMAKAGREPIFPVGRLHRYLKNATTAPRVSRKAAVAVASILEYLVGEVLESAAFAAAESKSRMLKPRHIALAVHADEDLDAIFDSTTISSGGVLPRVHNALLVKSEKKKKKKTPSKRKSVLW